MSADFARCDRFIAWMGQGAAGDPSRPSTVSDAPFAQRGSAPSVAPAEITTAIVVFLTGDSLARIAATYGLSVQQIVDANRLASPDAVAYGERLVIPLSRRPGEGAGRGTRTAGR